MKRILLVLSLLLSFSVQAASTEPGGVVDQNTQSRGTLSVLTLAITAGGVSQTALTANQFRKFVLIQNPSTATEPLCINFDAAAASASTVCLSPGQSWVFETMYMVTSQVNVWAATTSHAFVVVVN